MIYLTNFVYRSAASSWGPGRSPGASSVTFQSYRIPVLWWAGRSDSRILRISLDEGILTSIFFFFFLSFGCLTPCMERSFPETF